MDYTRYTGEPDKQEKRDQFMGNLRHTSMEQIGAAQCPLQQLDMKFVPTELPHTNGDQRTKDLDLQH